MPVLPHNQRAIDGIATPVDRRVQYRSKVVTGLELEILPSGVRTWRVRYRVGRAAARKFRAFTIGNAAHIKLGPATDKAREILAAVQLEGRDPQLDRKGTTDTFEALFMRWLENYAKIRRKSWSYDIALYERHIKERLGKFVPSQIKRADIARLRDAIASEVSPTQANKVQTLVSAVFGWAVNEGLLDSHPGYRLPKRGVEKPRERVLSEQEIRAFWRGLNTGPLSVGMTRILRLALLTGQRRSEIAEAQKSEFNFHEATWTIPSKRTKNGVTHIVPLSPRALSIVQEACADSQTDFVFPGRPAGHRDAINPHAVSRAMARLMDELECPRRAYGTRPSSNGRNGARTTRRESRYSGARPQSRGRREIGD